MSARFADKVKAHGIRMMRKAHHRTLHQSSEATYRRRQPPTSPMPRLMPAARRYRRMGWLPTSLIAPEKLPAEARLPLRYYLPYYGTSKLGWMLYGRSPIDPELPWDASSPWNEFFPEAQPGWEAPTTDSTFVSLRLQGPNPFMLKSVAADASLGEAAGAKIFTLDFTNRYEGIFPATEARFELGADGLAPSSIRVGDKIARPGDGDQWTDFKRVVNALDARESVFIRHLLNVHLMVGQAYALAAYSLPVWHPLRAFMDFFTYGTLVVNDAAYKALLMPDSYFLRAHFVSAADARRLVENSMTDFDFDEWNWPKDREKRGIGEIPDHPYVTEADQLWAIFREFVDGHLRDLYDDDDEIRADHHLRRWYETLCEVLPGDETERTITDRNELGQVMTSLLWNNVVHEVCGNLSPLLDYSDPRDPRDLMGVNFDHLRAMVDDDRDDLEPRAADVLLMDQATYVSRFNVAGNNLMTVNANRYVDDPRLRDAIIELQQRLADAEEALVARNAKRDIPFLNLEPSRFEASISF